MRGKAAIPLFMALQKIDPTIKNEHTFKWLFLPKSNERTKEEEEIINALWVDCKNRSLTKFQGKVCDFKEIYYFDNMIKGVSRRLEVDFYLPKYNLIIEMDEAQHFTQERLLTLYFYKEKTFHYDISKWRFLCEKISKKDSDPLTRDWKRAFRDSVRDLRAKSSNTPLLRLYIREFNTDTLNNNETVEKLHQLIIDAKKVF